MMLDDDLQNPLVTEKIEKPERHYWVVLWLHLAMIVLNSVPLFFYFQRSWELEHYQFFPIALIVFGVVIYSRARYGKVHDSYGSAFVSSVLLILSASTFLISFFQYNHYLPTIGVFFAIGSLLVCLRDRESGKSLFPVWLLLLPLIRIPLNFDITLISQLQFVSAWFASNVLDFLGIPNFTPGTIIQIAQQGEDSGVKRFDVERACSGVQSLYTLLFCTLTVAVWARRSFIAGLVLVASGVFWSITMNGIRIVICVSLFYWFDIDVYSGVRHEILGYLILFAAIGLIASTDALLGFLLGPIDVTAESRNVFAKFWNRMVAGAEHFGRRTIGSAPLDGFSRQISRGILIFFLAVANGVALLLFVVSFSGENLKGTYQVDALGFVADDLPIEIPDELNSARTWLNNPENFENVERNTNSTYGPYTSSWLFTDRADNSFVQLSVDYPFLGWHELKVCYKATGWTVERSVVAEFEWKPVEMYLTKENGDHAYCIFSLFDYKGESVEPISDNLGFFFLRLRNRIAREFSTTTTFQVQCFIQSFEEIPKAKIEAAKQFHLKMREEIKRQVLERLAE